MHVTWDQNKSWFVTKESIIFKRVENALTTFLFSRDAATDNESEEDVFESLVDDPILSSGIADEITISDEITIEESGIKIREEAEEGESDESSDKDEDEEGDENDVVENENKRGNSNDLKNLPCNGKCAEQEFHGCDDKCIVEDLTPYQVRKHLLNLTSTCKRRIWPKFAPSEQQKMHGRVLLCQM